MSLREGLSRYLLARRVRRYGNGHSAALNRHYLEYHRKARRAFDAQRHPLSEQAVAQARQLEREGFLVLPPPADFDVQALKAESDAAFDRPTGRYPVSPGLIRLIDGLEKLPTMVEVLAASAEGVLHAWFESFFKVFSVTTYRTVPDQSRPESSFLWHFDNAPDLQIKAMIYLDDVREETGAFRFKSKPVSEMARAAGFWHRRDYEKGRAVFENEETTHVVEGGPGTVVLFQPGRVVHKATAPRHGHRDVAVLVINPSTVYWREHLARNRHLLSTNAGLCLDLDRDTPENIGYRF